MVNTCSVVSCKTGYKKRENKEDKIPEKHPVFGFPDSKSDLKAKWVKLESRKFLKILKERIARNIEMGFKPSANSLL